MFVSYEQDKVVEVCMNFKGEFNKRRTTFFSLVHFGLLGTVYVFYMRDGCVRARGYECEGAKALYR